MTLVTAWWCQPLAIFHLPNGIESFWIFIGMTLLTLPRVTLLICSNSMETDGFSRCSLVASSELLFLSLFLTFSSTHTYCINSNYLARNRKRSKQIVWVLQTTKSFILIWKRVQSSTFKWFHGQIVGRFEQLRERESHTQDDACEKSELRAREVEIEVERPSRPCISEYILYAKNGAGKAQSKNMENPPNSVPADNGLSKNSNNAESAAESLYLNAHTFCRVCIKKELWN